MPKKLYHIQFTPDQQQEFAHLVNAGTHSARKIKRANMLLWRRNPLPIRKLARHSDAIRRRWNAFENASWPEDESLPCLKNLGPANLSK